MDKYAHLNPTWPLTLYIYCSSPVVSINNTAFNEKAKSKLRDAKLLSHEETSQVSDASFKMIKAPILFYN